MLSTGFVPANHTCDVLSIFILDGGLRVRHGGGGVLPLWVGSTHEVVHRLGGGDRVQGQQRRLIKVWDRRGRHDVGISPHGGRVRGHQCHRDQGITFLEAVRLITLLSMLIFTGQPGELRPRPATFPATCTAETSWGAGEQRQRAGALLLNKPKGVRMRKPKPLWICSTKT